jgi:hypothetical protein
MGLYEGLNLEFTSFSIGNIMQSLSTKTDNYLDLLATRLAEIRLSELGYHFVPGIYELFIHFKRFVEARARIVQPQRGDVL